MVKSPINPERITKTNNKSLEGALKFVSGGSSLGSSIVSGAANNIVGFNRTKVSPKQTNIQSLLELLSSNVFNSISSVKNIFNNKLEKKERGMSFFSGIFDKVKEALAFVRFFGDKKNLDKIKDSLNNLKDTFSETFEIAKALRKAIVKIFKELSGIDTSGGGKGGGLIGGILSAIGGLLGGLIPGRKGTRGLEGAKGARALEGEGNIFSKIPRMLKGGGGGLGKLLLGGGALAAGGMALSGLSAGPGNTEFQSGETPPEVPGDLLDKFNSILDRFDKVLDGLLKGGKGPDKKGGGSKPSSGGGSSPGGASPGGSSPGGGGGGSGGGESATIPQSILDTGMSKNMAGYLTRLSYLETRLRNIPNAQGSEGTGYYQAFNAFNQEATKASGGLSPRSSDFGTASKATMSWIYAYNKPAYNAILAGDYDKADSLLKGTWPSLPGGSQAQPQAVQTQARRYLSGQSNIPSALTLPPSTQQQIRSTPTPSAQQTPSTPRVQPAPAPAQAPGTRAQGLAVQRGQGQGNVNVISIPGQQQEPAAQPGGSQLSAPASPPKSGPTMPFLLAANTDNFLNLYSRMVYNIIDG